MRSVKSRIESIRRGILRGICPSLVSSKRAVNRNGGRIVRPPPSPVHTHIVSDRQTEYGWYQRYCFEPAVMLCFEDICWSGATVFDVGANVGALTVKFSRLVGPRGIVCAFEASPRIVGVCQANLRANGCGNTQLFDFAVYSRSFEKIPLYEMEKLNDCIHPMVESFSTGSKMVETLALDDFVASTGLVPDIIKFDIELGEYDALLGCADLIAEHRPLMILEQQVDDDRCLKLLKAAGYTAIDLNTYDEIRSFSDYRTRQGNRNLLYVHRSRLEGLPYRLPTRKARVVKLREPVLQPQGDAALRKVFEADLDKGRYIACFDLNSESFVGDNIMSLGVVIDGIVVVSFGQTLPKLIESCAEVPFHVEAGTTVKVYAEDPNRNSSPPPPQLFWTQYVASRFFSWRVLIQNAAPALPDSSPDSNPQLFVADLVPDKESYATPTTTNE